MEYFYENTSRAIPVNNFHKKMHFTPKKKDSFLMSLFLSSCFSFQTRADLVLVKFYFNAAVQSFLKTFRKLAGKRLWWKRFLGKFKLFKMDSCKSVFLSVFRIPFYGCFQTFNGNAFLSMITLFGANANTNFWQDLSKSERFFLLNAPKYLGARLFYSLYAQILRIFWNVFLQKNLWNLKGCS